MARKRSKKIQIHAKEMSFKDCRNVSEPGLGFGRRVPAVSTSSKSRKLSIRAKHFKKVFVLVKIGTFWYIREK